MATTFTKIQIMNAALLSQGFLEIAENDLSNEWRTLDANWNQIVEGELEAGSYTHSYVEYDLTRDSDGGFGFADRYLTPIGALHVRAVWTVGTDGERCPISWFQGIDAIHVNEANGISIETIEDLEEAQLGPNLVIGLQKKLEAVLLRIKEEFGEANQMEAQAEFHLSKARTVSSRRKSPRPLFAGPEAGIAAARFRRRG